MKQRTASMIAQHPAIRCVRSVADGSRRISRSALGGHVLARKCSDTRRVVAYAGEGDLSSPANTMSVDEALSILGLTSGEGSFEQVLVAL